MRRGLVFVIAFLLGAGQASAQDPFDLLFGEDPAIEVGPPGAPSADDLMLVSLRLGNIRFGRSLPAYRTPAGLCLVISPLIDALEAPVAAADDRLTGWFITEERTIEVDFSHQTMRIAGRPLVWPDDAALEAPEGRCISLALAGKLFAGTFKFSEIDLSVGIEPLEVWPIEARLEREKRRAELLSADGGRPDFPELANPVRWLAWPTADIALDWARMASGETQLNIGGLMIGDVARMTGRLQSTRQPDGTNGFRLTMGRETGVGGGVAMGDVVLPAAPLLTATRAGRGLRLSSASPSATDTFDQYEIRGPLPDGWEAELHDEGGLRAFTVEPDANGDYVFDNLVLRSGYNRFIVKLYGPQGEVRERPVRFFVGEDMTPENEVRWDLAVVQTGVSFNGEAIGQRPEWIATGSLHAGLSDHVSTSLRAALSEKSGGAIAGALSASAGPAFSTAKVALDAKGRSAVQATTEARLGASQSMALSWTEVDGMNNTALGFGTDGLVRAAEARYNGQVQVAGHRFPLTSTAYTEERAGGRRAQRFSAATNGRFRGMVWRKSALYQERGAENGERSAELGGAFLVSGRIGPHRLRGGIRYQCRDTCSGSALSGSYQADLGAAGTLNVGMTRDLDTGTDRVSASILKPFGPFSAGLNMRSEGNGRWSAGVGLRFALYRHPAQGRLRAGPVGMTESATILANVFEDRDGDGRRQSDEPAVSGASFIVGGSLRRSSTGQDGAVVLDRVPAGRLSTLELKRSSLPDPFLMPLQQGSTMRLRQGQVLAVDVPVRMTGEAEVTVTLDRGGFAVPVAGVPVEALDDRGQTVATAMTAYDGSAYLSDLPLQPLTLRVASDALKGLGAVSEPMHIILNDQAPYAADIALSVELR